MSVHNRGTRLAVSGVVFVVVVALIVPHLMDVKPPLIVDVLLAPTWLIGGLVGGLIPTGNIGTPDDPVYEATPIHMIAGLTFAFINNLLYPVLTYVVLSLVSKVLKRRVRQE